MGPLCIDPAGEDRLLDRHPLGCVVFSIDRRTGEDWPLLRPLAALLNHLLWPEATRPLGWQALALHAHGTGASGTRTRTDPELPVPNERSMALVRARWSPGSPTRTPSLDELADAAAGTREHLCRV